MSAMTVIKRGKYNYNPKPRKICNMPEKKFFGLDNIKEQHDKIKRILNRRSVVTDRE